MSHDTDIFNGSRCKSYSWSQSHGDLEIRIRVERSIRVDDVQVDVTKRDICVEVIPSSSMRYDPSKLSEILMEGDFEHPVDTDSVYWIIESEKSHHNIVIFIDKLEDIWWKKLLIDEEAIKSGPRYYSVPIDELNDSSRMAIDRLIKEQQQKRSSKVSIQYDDDSPV